MDDGQDSRSPLFTDSISPVRSSRSYVPHVGYMTIILNDYPKLKYALLGLIGVSVLFSGEDA